MKLKIAVCFVTFATVACAAELNGLSVRHINGQTFVQWTEKDVSPGDRIAVYTASEPITGDNIQEAELLCRDLMPGTSCDFVDLRAAKYKRFKPLPLKEVRGAVVPSSTPGDKVAEAERVEPYNGLYVHTPAIAGKAFFAVALCDDDGKPVTPIVPGESSLRDPVDEVVADEWAPIRVFGRPLQETGEMSSMPLFMVLHAIGGFQNDRKARKDLERRGIEGEHFVVYGNKNHGWREGIPFNFSVYHAPDRLELWLDDSNFAFMGFKNSWWVGVNRKITRPKELSSGRIYPCNEKRVMKALDWVMDNYPVDPKRVQLYGSSMGGTGALMLTVRHPERFCAVDLGVPAVSLQKLPNLRGSAPIIWGPMDSDVLCSDGQSIWERIDTTQYLREHAVTLPLLRISHGRNDGWMRWPYNPPFYRLLQEQGQPCWVFWDDKGHSNSSRTRRFPEAYHENLFAYALDKPILAFADGTANDDPGNGEIDNGAPAGCLNYFYRFADITDAEDLFSVEYWYERDGKTDGGQVDLLPLRLQAFPCKPGQSASFKILADGKTVKEGEVKAGERGNYRVQRVPADRRYTLEMRPQSP